MTNRGQSISFRNSNLPTDFQIFLFSLNIILKTSSNTQRNWKNCTKNTDTPTSAVLPLPFSLTASSHLYIPPSLYPSILFFLRILKKKKLGAVPHSMGDLSPPIRNQSRVPCVGGLESQPLDCQGGPRLIFVTFQGQLLRQHTSACVSLTRIWCVCVCDFLEAKFRYSEMPKLEEDHLMNFDASVIQAPMPIYFELNLTFFCHVLIFKCPYPVSWESPLNWALWKIPFICLILLCCPRPRNTCPFENKRQFAYGGGRVGKNISTGSVGLNLIFTTF